ncbi:hypothetical protein ACH5RR_034213 [Cinchona calisaya]|uniref:Secreted protein n=1 Tax=Cinchona calisaya TaxID=153742 RepID=A0ABD2YA79_9GENT
MGLPPQAFLCLLVLADSNHGGFLEQSDILVLSLTDLCYQINFLLASHHNKMIDHQTLTRSIESSQSLSLFFPRYQISPFFHQLFFFGDDTFQFLGSGSIRTKVIQTGKLIQIVIPPRQGKFD